MSLTPTWRISNVHSFAAGLLICRGWLRSDCKSHVNCLPATGTDIGPSIGRLGIFAVNLCNCPLDYITHTTCWSQKCSFYGSSCSVRLSTGWTTHKSLTLATRARCFGHFIAVIRHLYLGHVVTFKRVALPTAAVVSASGCSWFMPVCVSACTIKCLVNIS